MSITRPSYPYLELSRRFSVPYGTVLALADAVEKPGREWDVWTREAVAATARNHALIEAVYATYTLEQAARRCA